MYKYLRLFFLSFTFDYNGGVLSLLLPEEASIQTAKILVGSIGFLMSIDIKHFTVYYKSNKALLFLLLLFLIYYFLNPSYQAYEYYIYKYQLLLANIATILMVSISLRNERDIRLYIAFGTLQLATGFIAGNIALFLGNTSDIESIIVSRTGAIMIVYAIFFGGGGTRFHNIIIGIIGLLAILASGNRTIYISLIIVYALMIFVDTRVGTIKIGSGSIKRAFKYLFIAVSMWFVLLLNPFSSSYDGLVDIKNAVISLLNFSTYDNSTIERVALWTLSIEIWSNNPIYGIGFGGFAFEWLLDDARMYPHNLLLELLSEGGIIALLLFSTFAIIIYKRLLSASILYKEGTSRYAFSLFIMGVLSAMSSLELSNQFILFLSFTIALAMNSSKNNRRNEVVKHY